jgi:hypothetical protein
VQKLSEIISDIIHQSPFLSEALAEGLINVSSLARKIGPEVEKASGRPIKEGAIIMAINRMPVSEVFHIDKNLRQFFKQLSDISVRSSLLDYTFLNTPTLLDKQAQLLHRISKYPKVFYSFSQGVSETTILITDSLEAELEDIFKAERLLNKEKNLSSVTLMLPEENRTIYGIYYYITKELAINGINIVELISTSNEFTVVLANKDLDRAFSVLMGLRKQN